MSLIQTRGLTKSFKSEKVLDKVNFDLQSDSIYCLVGPNGSGKSTFISLLLGLLKADEGDIYIDGVRRSNSNIPNFKYIIGSVLTNHGLYLDLSVEVNLKISCCYNGVEDSCIETLLSQVNLLNANQKLVKHLSLGMKQKLAIACSLVANPKVLILDEPTNGLDPYAVESLKNLLLRLKSQGVSILLVTHQLDDVEEIADQIGFLNRGVIRFQCTMEELKNTAPKKILIQTTHSEQSYQILSQEYPNSVVMEESLLTIKCNPVPDAAEVNKILALNNIFVEKIMTETDSVTKIFEELCCNEYSIE